jgi:hypothetical protein
MVFDLVDVADAHTVIDVTPHRIDGDLTITNSVKKKLLVKAGCAAQTATPVYALDARPW